MNVNRILDTLENLRDLGVAVAPDATALIVGTPERAVRIRVSPANAIVIATDLLVAARTEIRQVAEKELEARREAAENGSAN